MLRRQTSWTNNVFDLNSNSFREKERVSSNFGKRNNKFWQKYIYNFF